MSEWLIIQTIDGWRVEHRWDYYAPSRTFATRSEAEAWVRTLNTEVSKLLRGLPR